MAEIYDFSAASLDGKETSLDTLRGKVLLIVNTASKCGFTPQYAGLEQLQQTYADQGFTVLGFPCDQFGHQEPGDAAEIASFCSTKYDVSFPMFAKVEVNGSHAHPAVGLAEVGEVGVPRRRHQVELHQVSDRPRRHGAGTLSAHHHAGRTLAEGGSRPEGCLTPARA